MRAAERENITGILDNLVRVKHNARSQRYKLVVFEDNLVFLRVNKRWFFRKKTDYSYEELSVMSPVEVKRLSMGSFLVELSEVIEIRVKESIPFVLMLDPKEAVSFNLTGLDDDIVHEVPLVLRRDRVKGVDIVEREWELVFETRKVTFSFIVPYDPSPVLPMVLSMKLASSSSV
ncbi:MAG: hypothetical protein NWF07_04765 [Candidatus Bathyarchaeota archaeon]|nr:hypothetical protein [Candidatus Bathyarchaeota archaeon]